jgi:hypothetical protein
MSSSQPTPNHTNTNSSTNHASNYASQRSSSFNITQQGTNSNRRSKPAFPPVYYFSKTQKRKIRTNDLPHEPNHVGIYSPWAFVWGAVAATVPVAYLYILLILLRELSLYWPEFAAFLHHYLPPLATLITLMHKSSTFVEVWCLLEAVFYVTLKIYMLYLDTRDPLEASLRSAPFMKPHERQLLWQRMMQVEKEDPASLISGWFFDQDIHKISRYDVREFVTWSMFEGRNQEHLTRDELQQLEEFVQSLEYSISLHWYGVQETEENNHNHNDNHNHEATPPPPQPRKSKFPALPLPAQPP